MKAVLLGGLKFYPLWSLQKSVAVCSLLVTLALWLFFLTDLFIPYKG